MTVYFSSQARLAASRASPLVIDAFAKNTTRFRFPRTRVHTNAFAFCVSLAFKPRFHRVSLSRKRARSPRSKRARVIYIYLASVLYRYIMYVSISFSFYIYALYFSQDIDECTSGNDTCHINATCINTVGSYDCQVSWDVDSIVQVSACLVLHAY